MFAACGNPNHDEFDKYISRTKKQAFNIACRLTGNRDDAEDLVQEAYLRAYRGFDKYKREKPFENWFFRILSNLFVDSLRRKGKHQLLSLDQLLGESNKTSTYFLEIIDEIANPESLIMNDVFDERIERSLASLPKEYCKAVLLCDVEGLSYQEIADITKCPLGTVRSRLHRGRMMLRESLGDTATPRLNKTASRN